VISGEWDRQIQAGELVFDPAETSANFISTSDDQ
jgi:hypothetical protein